MSATGEGGSGSKGGAGKGKGKAVEAQEGAGQLKRKRGIFHRDLQPMMYGFGDDPKPMPETVELVEDILVDYITDMLHKVRSFLSYYVAVSFLPSSIALVPPKLLWCGCRRT
jgi:transcription initiation factor TFIID subunit 13